MFEATAYLKWARRFYGQVPFDLASSGTPTVAATELGLPTRPLDDPAGWGALREALARYNDVSPGECIAALGTSHAVWLAYAAALSPGDDVLVEEPGYEPLLRAAAGCGARVVRFQRSPSEKFTLDPAKVRAALTPRTRMVVVSNLHNPSGVRAPDEVLQEVARVLDARGALLLVDEVYAPFDDLASAGVFARSARKLGRNVLVASSLTKCYGLGADRFGWMLGPPEVVLRAEDAMTATCGMLPLAHAHMFAHALSQVEPLAARAKALLAGKRARVAAWMKSRPDLDYSAPDAGLFGFAIAHEAPDLTSAIERGAREHGVLVAAGSFFGVANGFRIAWSIDSAKLDEALRRLARVL